MAKRTFKREKKGCKTASFYGAARKQNKSEPDATPRNLIIQLRWFKDLLFVKALDCGAFLSLGILGHKVAINSIKPSHLAGFSATEFAKEKSRFDTRKTGFLSVPRKS
ncbi:hypothetical protein AVEN_265903-1 [Araneus ventricosus]|uniref:Uncharacterized protein n=1 Tax=Araneus ventricosus TaxID=182803 RepID=A0A4Y2JDJ0_ARAVE|nr:hypothetical protein AVEN_265903-1 [Araneus ventricosus]